MTETAPFLIVGQGIAGTMMAWHLAERNLPFVIIDQGHQTASTRAAAGIMNPVTGRRFVKTWQADELLPYAKAIYRKMEKALGSSYLRETSMLRTFSGPDDENQWAMRLSDPAYHGYLAQAADPEDWSAVTKPAFGYGETLGVAQVDVGRLIADWRKRWLKQGILRAEPFDYQALVPQERAVQYQNKDYRAVIFAEGWQGRHNPFFKALPLVASKGEVVFLDGSLVASAKLFKRDLIFAPMLDGRIWVGSANKWHSEITEPTEKGRLLLEEKITNVLSVTFDIIDHDAGIRPAVKDRRPLIGRHPKFSNLLFFNGLGAKGTSLAPYLAKALFDAFLTVSSLPVAVDLQRYLESK